MWTGADKGYTLFIWTSHALASLTAKGKVIKFRNPAQTSLWTLGLLAFASIGSRTATSLEKYLSCFRLEGLHLIFFSTSQDTNAR